MPDERFRNAPDGRAVVSPGTITEELPPPPTPEEQQRRSISYLSTTVRNLKTWLGVLTGLSIISLGILGGLAYYFKRESDQMQRQLSTLNAYKAEADRVTKLESQVAGMTTQMGAINSNLTLLNQQVPKDLPNQIKAIQTDISALKGQVQTNTANSLSAQELQRIQRALAEQNRR